MPEGGNHDTSKVGSGETTHGRSMAEAIKPETVKKGEHWESQTSVDKETHQDHLNHTAQPVYSRRVLPEQHERRVSSGKHVKFDELLEQETKNKAKKEWERYHDERGAENTPYTKSEGVEAETEHVHRHIHETVQPFIFEGLGQSRVFHPTNPVHEPHHKPAQHHDTTTLPGIGLSDFLAMTDFLAGKEGSKDVGEDQGVGTEEMGGVKDHGKPRSSGGHKRRDSGMHMGQSGPIRRMQRTSSDREEFPSLLKDLDKLPSIKQLNPLADTSGEASRKA
ncbi:hypothetical protein F4780DRAFT_776712 [Xylariomycetidae sp. FL0641]|nr:hypothetical protein F4780DRAFT_776712 [Xylariomycetidae sp. FL0641]